MAQEIVRAARDAGGYLAEILGDLPKDLLSLLIGDRVRIWRIERLVRLWMNAKSHLQKEGITEPSSPNLKLAVPILLGAADENREALQDLWARLLAATMNPNKSDYVRLRFAEALQRLDPLDAKVLQYLRGGSGRLMNDEKEKFARSLEVSLDEFLVSQDNLTRVGFMTDYNSVTCGLTPLAREFLRAVSN